MFPGHLERRVKTLCFKGGGGGGTGQVSYPSYMETMHSAWLTDLDGLITSAVAATSPYVTATQYDPDTDLAAVATALSSFSAVVTAYDPLSSWSTNFDSIMTSLDENDSTINVTDQVDAHAEILDSDLNTRVLPTFRRTMQNLGASMSSAFVIGEAMIISDRDRQLNKFQAELELKNVDLNLNKNKILVLAVEQLMTHMDSRIEFYKSLLHYTSEVKRIKIVAKNEETTANLEYDVKDATWDLGLFQQGANMLAAIGGGTTQQNVPEPSRAQSAIGGAMAGAAMGTAVSPGVGTAVGAGVGFIAGLLT
jgi:hypothetical protein